MATPHAFTAPHRTTDLSRREHATTVRLPAFAQRIDVGGGRRGSLLE